MTDEGARVFREAWIAGVRKHFPGDPKPSYVTPWEETPEWERAAAGAVYAQVRQFLELSGGHASRLSREQKGRFVATSWTARMYQHFEDPKPGYVADWPDLPDWQKETDADIFEAVEESPRQASTALKGSVCPADDVRHHRARLVGDGGLELRWSAAER